METQDIKIENKLNDKHRESLSPNKGPKTMRETSQEEMEAIKKIIESGTIINENSGTSFYVNIGNTTSAVNLYNNQNEVVEKLMTPTVFILKKTHPLSIGLLLTAYSSLPLAELNIKFYYKLGLNRNDGLPKLTIFAYFNESKPTDPPSTKVYYENFFEMNFGNPLVPDIKIETIKTIEVFLTEGDPRTSRGTVTTVTEPVNPIIKNLFKSKINTNS
jgi:hypothetical protein